jgi:hypothetical protein
MAEVLRSGRTPHLSTSVSAAVRLCQSALEAGLDVSGGQFTLHGEALTATRLAVLRRAGTHPVSSYSSTESGPVAYGCLAPQAPDDLHFMHDRLALIQPATDAMPELPPLALLVSSLRPTARFLLLNVSLGDQAQMVRRTCGCPLERLGWITHLHTIRSFAKVTAGGMTLPDSEVARVLEEVLPAHFGGGPTDYQLVEEDGADGQPVLRLLVHPSIGPLDDEPIGDTFLNAMGEGLGAERVMELQWRRAGLLRVERRPPLVTPSGKVLHFHRVASADGAAAH